MPTFAFDVTEKCVAFMKETIKDMPGNPGQETLVRDLDYSGCRFTVYVEVSFLDQIDISSEYDINIYSNHPEAIEIIIQTAEEAGELIGNLASEAGPWDLIDARLSNDWKIVGWDLSWS